MEEAGADEESSFHVYLASFLGAAFLAQIFSVLVPGLASMLMFTAPAPLALLYRAGGVSAGLRGSVIGLAVLWVACLVISGILAWAMPGQAGMILRLLAAGATLHAQLVATGTLLGLALAGQRPVAFALIAATLVVSSLIAVEYYGIGHGRQIGRQANGLLTGARTAVTPPDPAKPAGEELEIEKMLEPLTAIAGKAESSEQQEWVRWLILWCLQVPVLMMGLSGAVFVWAAAIFVKWWAIRQGQGSDPWEWEFGEWRLPWTYSWTLITCGLMLALSLAMEDLWWISFWTQCLMLAFMPYGVLVFSIAYNFMERWRFPPPLRVLFYVVILFNSTFLCFLALLDPWADFRRMKFPTGEGGGEDGDES